MLCVNNNNNKNNIIIKYHSTDIYLVHHGMTHSLGQISTKSISVLSQHNHTTHHSVDKGITAAHKMQALYHILMK